MYAQTSLSGRFQKYSPDWFDYSADDWPKTELMDFGLVEEMKVAMYVGLFDNTCQQTTAEAQYTQMGKERTVAHFVVAPW